MAEPKIFLKGNRDRIEKSYLDLLSNRRSIWFYPEIEFAFLMFVQDGSN